MQIGVKGLVFGDIFRSGHCDGCDRELEQWQWHSVELVFTNRCSCGLVHRLTPTVGDLEYQGENIPLISL